MCRNFRLSAVFLLAIGGGGFSSASAANDLLESLPVFRDVTPGSGLEFVHINGIRDEKSYLPETKGGGVAFLDYDGDGWLDVLLVQGSTVERHQAGKDPRSELFRNLGGGRFRNVTEAAGLLAEGWGMGAATGDYDNDGDVDIYLTCLGPNRLFRNEGNGFFVEGAAQAGVADPRWSTSAAFGDYDGDGDLDLYVANYVEVNFAALKPKSCRYREAVVLCGPTGLPGVADSLYRNNGDGTFTEVGEALGAFDSGRAYGLGVVWGDLDNDSDLDLFVGNDATPNLFFVNQSGRTFEEQGLLSGLAVNAEGREQASMGMDLADYDNDGLLDAYLTHFADDYSTLYRNEGNLVFRDVTAQARILQPEIGKVSWGVKFVDFNNDGWKDIFHVNGHVYPYLITAGLDETFDQPASFYVNRGDGTFLDASTLAGDDIRRPLCSRGVAFADWDNDGDYDFLVLVMNSTPVLFRTDRRDSGHWVMFKMVGRLGNRDGLGARLDIRSGSLRQTWEIKTAGSIYSASDPRAHFGIGRAARIDELVVRWPSGMRQTFHDLEVDRHYLLDEEKGLSPEEFAPPAPR